MSIFSILFTVDCGNRTEIKVGNKTSRHKRFIGGGQDALPVDISRWPWVVSLQYRSSDLQPFQQRCSGVIIKRGWILTAAECFYKFEYRSVLT